MDPSPQKKFWMRRARKSAFAHNLAWWLSDFFDFALLVTAVFVCLQLLLRKLDKFSPAVWGIYAGLLLLGGLFASWRLRSQWFSRQDALVRIEARMGLKNRLSSAAAGIGEFPAQSNVDTGWHWRWSRLLALPTASLFLLFVGTKLPLSSNAETTLPLEAPPALTQTEAWVEELAQEKLVEEKSLEALRKELAALRNLPPEEWYRQAGLEASDHLREQTAHGIRELMKHLQTSNTVLEALQKMGDSLSPEAMEQLTTSWQEAMQGLAMGNLPLDPDTLKKLKSIDLKNMRKMSREDMAALQKRLQEGLGTCQSAGGVNLRKDGDLLARLQKGGNGGVNRGPGSVPLALSSHKTDLQTRNLEGLKSKDFSRALPGEVEGISKGEHEIDAAQFGAPTAAGQIATPGSGGDAVWRDSFTPEERHLLQRFFQ